MPTPEEDLLYAIFGEQPIAVDHWECNCVPDLGPTHCHGCSEIVGHPVTWEEAEAVGHEPHDAGPGGDA